MTDYRAIAAKLQEREEAGLPQDAAFWLEELERAIGYRSDRVVEAAQSVVDTANRTIQTVRTNRTLNSLGELQGRGPELDRRVAELCFAQDALSQAKGYLSRMYPEAAKAIGKE